MEYSRTVLVTDFEVLVLETPSTRQIIVLEGCVLDTRSKKCTSTRVLFKAKMLNVFWLGLKPYAEDFL